MPLYNPPLPRQLFSTSIPFVFPSSGSIGNNGALTGVTALPHAYPKAYVYVPANAIAAGVAAGFYYAVFSSTTAATLYNNPYVSGVPTVPASPTAFATTGPGAYTQTTATNVIGPTFTLAANTLSSTGRLRIDMGGRAPSNANAKNVSVAFNTNTVCTMLLNSATGNEITARVRGMSATNRQTTSVVTFMGSAYGFVPSDQTHDTTASQTVDIRFNIATATDFVVLSGCEFVLEA